MLARSNQLAAIDSTWPTSKGRASQKRPGTPSKPWSRPWMTAACNSKACHSGSCLLQAGQRLQSGGQAVGVGVGHQQQLRQRAAQYPLSCPTLLTLGPAGVSSRCRQTTVSQG